MERGYTMKKKIVSLAVAIVMFFAFAMPFYAATINLSTEIDGILNDITHHVKILIYQIRILFVTVAVEQFPAVGRFDQIGINDGRF